MANKKELTMKEKRAEKLAEFIHHGQKRRNSEDAVEHSKRVAMAIKELGFGEDEVCASFLHDLEDFKWYAEAFKLIEDVFDFRVAGLVLLLSHRPKSMPYNDYIYRIAEKSKEAMEIKFQDMLDNTKGDIPKRQLDKYRNACIFLRSRNIEVPDVLMDRLDIEILDQKQLKNGRII